MGNELASRYQPVADWSNGPDGMPPMLHGTFCREWRAVSKPDRAELPEVRMGSSPPLAANDTAAGAARINPTTRELRFIVPLTDGPGYLGDVELAVSPTDELSVEAPRLLDLLKPILVRDSFTRLTAAVSAGDRLTAAALAGEGISLTYDPIKLALSMEIAVPKRFTRSQSYRDQPGNYTATLQPATFSAYLNIHAQAEFVEAGPARGVVPPTAALDAAARFGPLVAESEAYVSARRGDPAFRRTGSRLVFDDQHNFMRWTLGDMQVFTRPFQASPTIAGLGVSRLYSQVDPQREIRTSGGQSFSVLSPSIIETFVNGRSIERRTFQPGNYDLRDFPLAEGANAVKLQIEDASGKRRNIDFSVYANQALLTKGITEFSVQGGVYSNPTQTGIAYSRKWAAGGFIRRGLAQQLTGGLNFQANRSVRTVGTEILWGSPIGLAGFNLTASNARGLGSGLAAAIVFERLLSYNGGARTQSFRASAEWRSKRFVIPEVEFGPDRVALRASAGYVVTLGANSFVAADATYSRDRFAHQASWGGRLSGGFDLTPRLAVNTEIGVNRGSPRNETYGRVGLRIRLSDRATAQIEADSKGRARASYSNSGGSGIGAWQVGGDLGHDNDNVSLNASANLVTNRAEIGIQQTGSWASFGMRLTDARANVHAAFALAFADGALALGRPVSEAFVIARTHRTLAGKPVYLEPSGQSETARSGGLGPALNGQISAHSFRTIIYEVPGAPSGYDLGAGNIAIRPPYRAGYKLTIGSDYNLLVIGRLLDAGGEPVRLLAGKAIDLGEPKHPAITVFTSRDGKFGAQGLRPGRWRIEMPAESPIAYEFTVTTGADGIVRIGELRPVPATGKQ